MVILVNIGCDQISKNIARKNISYGEVIDVIPEYFVLTKVENTGAFLSLGSTLPETLRIILLSVLPVGVLLLVTYFLFKHSDQKSQALALAFVVGGGIGNMYDRIVHGSVTDFVHMDFVIFQTGVFNFADLSIMIGAGIILANYLKNKFTPTPSKDLV